MLATIGIGLRTNPEDVPQSNRHAKLLHQHLPSRRAALRSAIQTRGNKQIARKSATHQRPIVRDHSLFRTQRTNQSTRKEKRKNPRAHHLQLNHRGLGSAAESRVYKTREAYLLEVADAEVVAAVLTSETELLGVGGLLIILPLPPRAHAPVPSPRGGARREPART